MGKSSKPTIGYWYKLLLHFGFCRGPIDAFLEFRGGDKPAWQGELTSSGTIAVNARELWGGEKQEGGIEGNLSVMFGEPDQAPNAYLLANLGADQSAYRGRAGAVFEGGLYGAFNPYPKPASFKVRRILKGWDNDECWYPETAAVSLPGQGLSTFSEDFVENSLENYSATEGTTLPFSVSGGYMNLGPAGTGHNVIARDLPVPGELYLVSAIVTLVSMPSEDCGAFGLADSEGNLIFALQSCREAGVDALRRPTVVLAEGSGGEGNPIGSGHLALGVPYIFSASYDSATNEFNCSLTERDTGVSFGSISVTVTGNSPVHSLVFIQDGGSSSGAARFATIRVTSPGGAMKAMNPAHMLYDSVTSQEMQGEPIDLVNDANFRAAADIFYAEGFGLCTSYDANNETVEDFQQRICNIAGCSLNQSRVDGKYYLTVIRGDYDIDTLPILDDDDILEFTAEPTDPLESVNQVTVEWFDPVKKEKRATAPLQSLGAIQATGGILAEVEQFPEIPYEDLALRVGARNLQEKSTPRWRFNLTTNRKPYAWRGGQFFRLQAPRRGIADMVCLLGEVDAGTPRSGTMRLVTLQDVSGMPTTTYVTPEPGVDTSTSQTPSVPPASLAFEAPYPSLAARLPSAELAGIEVDTGFLAVVAQSPAAGSNYALLTAADGEEFEEHGTGDWCPTATVVEAADKVETAFTLASGTDLDRIIVGSAALWDDEIVRVDALNTATGAVTLARACVDTVPQEHAAGARIWFYDEWAAGDGREYIDGELVHAKALTRTSSQRLPENLATDLTVTMDSRASRPYPPGLFQIDGDDYPATNAGGTSMSITWGHRDRLAQADQLLDTTAASVGPEATVRYALRFLRDDTSALLVEKLNLTGTSATAVLNYTGDVVIQLYAISDNGESWQRHEHTFAYTPPTGTTGSVITGGTYDPSAGGIIIDGGEVTAPPESSPTPPVEGGTGGGGTAYTSRTRGATVLVVSSALGTGTGDATAAIQAVIDSLPGDGGTVQIPAGSSGAYMINSAAGGLFMRDNMHLELLTGAHLKGKTNSVDLDIVVNVLDVDNFELSGGWVEGDRDSFVPVAGTTSEHGYGIAVRGSTNVTIRHTTTSNCVGDGVYVGRLPTGDKHYSDSVEIYEIVSDNNRRQGISLTNCTNIKVWYNHLLNTNGTSPAAGIDVEPNYADTLNARYIDIKGNTIRGNNGAGIQLWRSARDVTITGNTIEENGYGIIAKNSDTTTVSGSNVIRHNREKAISLKEDAVNFNVSGATMFNNSTASRPYVSTGSTTAHTGLGSWSTYHIGTGLLSSTGAASLTVGSNNYGGN